MTGVITGLVAGAAWGAYSEVRPAIMAHDYFRLRSIKVVCDSAAAEPATLAARAGLYDGTSLWEIDTNEAKRALASVPWVRDARIFRRFPDEVAVEVFRRDPVGITLAGGVPYLIDRDGVVYREGNAMPHLDLPYLTGWEQAPTREDGIARLRMSMSIVDAVQAAGISISQVNVDPGGDYRLYPDGLRIAVVLGSRPHAATIAKRLAALWPALGTDAADVREIDFTYADRAIVRTNAGRTAKVSAALRAGAASGPNAAAAIDRASQDSDSNVVSEVSRRG